MTEEQRRERQTKKINQGTKRKNREIITLRERRETKNIRKA